MKETYIDMMDQVVDAYTSEHIRRYIDSVIKNGLEEHGFPRLTANLGILIAHGKKQEYKETFLEMMNLCCKEIPTAHEKNGDRVGNDFSVKEIIFCIMELEKAQIFDKSLTDNWRDELRKIVPKETYTKIAPYPPSPVNNWAAFGAASEQLRKFAGMGDESFFIENQIASQMFSFDENGMYRDPHEPIVYDLVTRLQLAVALRFGYDGKHQKELEENFLKSADLTLKMQSVTGEIPFGGRSNQFLHNEAFYAALCEFYAWLFKKHGNIKKAGQFRRSARLAVESILPWLEKNPVPHIKNSYSTDSMYGCECYAYYDKYMVTTASWLYLAYAMCDESISEDPCPMENENYILETSTHFHKVFLKFGDYFAEFDTYADLKYDASGLGRVHKKGASPVICMSVPCPPNEANYETDIKNLSPFSICGGIKCENGFAYGNDNDTKYTLVKKEVTEKFARVSFYCETKNGKSFTQTCTLSENGAEICVEGDDRVSILFPLFDFDGKNFTKKEINNNTARVTHNKSACIFSADAPITDTGKLFANRNGHYKALSVCAENSVTLKIAIE